MLISNVKLENKKILITGISGFIGSNLAKALLKQFEDIVSNKPKRTAKDIKQDLLIKFNKRS